MNFSEDVLGKWFPFLGPTLSRPSTYQKKPLNQAMTKVTRRRRVMEKRDVLEKWAMEEGVSVASVYIFKEY